MMTRSSESVSRITPGPCPIWCEIRSHEWTEVNVFEHGDYGRTHELHLDGVEVSWTEVPARPDHRTPTVDVDEHDIRSMDDAERVISLLRMAAHLAFDGATR